MTRKQQALERMLAKTRRIQDKWATLDPEIQDFLLDKWICQKVGKGESKHLANVTLVRGDR